jgi:hypothetical protein
LIVHLKKFGFGGLKNTPETFAESVTHCSGVL